MDEDRWTSQRRRMVREQLQRRGISDPGVLDALTAVPREHFVPPETRRWALRDQALEIGHGQTISQPYMVAVMTEALEVEAGHRVLEIGTGSGYQAAVLSALDTQVYSIERVSELADRARAVLDALGFGDVRVRSGDGTKGWPEAAPFDRIVVTAAGPTVPRTLSEQLSPEGGRLVAPVGPRDLQRLVVVERVGNTWTQESLLECRFVPLLGEEGWGPM